MGCLSDYCQCCHVRLDESTSYRCDECKPFVGEGSSCHSPDCPGSTNGYNGCAKCPQHCPLKAGALAPSN